MYSSSPWDISPNDIATKLWYILVQSLAKHYHFIELKLVKLTISIMATK